MGKQISLRFTLTQHIRDKLLINNIKNYFDCGLIVETSKLVRFVVNNLDDINKHIIPFFNKYYLQTNKRLDYKDFLKVLNLMINKEHLNPDGVDKIMNIKAGMNRSRKQSAKENSKNKTSKEQNLKIEEN